MKTLHYWQIYPKYIELYKMGYLLQIKMITMKLPCKNN